MKQITIWTQDGCMLCETVKEFFSAQSYEERDADELIQGMDKNPDAMVQLAMQDMQLPLVAIDGVFQDLHALLAKIEESAA